MGGLGRWISAHAGVVMALAILVAFVTAGSVARCCAIHAPEDESEQQSPEALAEEALPDEARALRKSYSGDTTDALGMLAANVWTDGQGTSVVTFTDRALCIRSQGDEEWLAYVVTASAKKTASQSGTTTTVTTLCLETADWTDIATLTVPGNGNEGDYPTFSCPSICGGSELILSPALKDIVIDGPSDDYLVARKTNRTNAESTLAQWCALWRPTATTATWTEVVEEDHSERVCKIYYKLDDQRSSTVTLVVGMDDGTLTVEEGGR